MGTHKNQNSANYSALHNGSLDDLIMIDADRLRDVLTPQICLAALEDVYRSLHSAPADKGRSVGFQTQDGKFHVKAGLYPGTHDYFVAKVNANFPDNRQRHGLPTIQGVIVLCDGRDGQPLALLQSGELTGRRTAAATALAARHGARPDARTLAIIGCGAQARYQIEAVIGVLPIRRVISVDRVRAESEALAIWAGEILGLDAAPGVSIADAVASSDIIVTCTTGSAPIITPDMTPSGCFIAAVGADNPDKQELDPELFENARILVDDLDQCASDGDLAHAIRAGTTSTGDVAATLAELAAGEKSGRTREDEIVIFDSTGTGLQDVAAAVAAFEAAQ